MPAGPAREAATDRLLAGQSNDPYWHGLFGGIYLPDLRLANHANLVAAEDLALGGGAGETGVELDLDLDGRPEILLANAGEFVTIKPDEGAGIGRWDVRAARLALGAVLRRRPEAYHEKVRRLDATAAATAADATAPAGADATDEEAPASIHDIVMTKQSGLSAHLRYDADERRSGLLRFLAPDVTADQVAAGVDDRGDFASGAWTVGELTADGATVVRDGLVRTGERAISVRAQKTIRIGGDRLAPTLTMRTSVTNTGDEPLTARVAIEWSTMLLGGGGNPAAWQESGGIRLAHDARLEAAATDRMTAGNDFLGVCVATRLDPPADVWTAPIETVSNSEAGFELVYQGSSVLFGRVVTLGPGETATIAVEHTATVTPGLGFGATTGA
jgi:alpha-amylase